jgi:probable F420-dependent oxidoreductase
MDERVEQSGKAFMAGPYFEFERNNRIAILASRLYATVIAGRSRSKTRAMDERRAGMTPRHPFRFGVINEMALPAGEWIEHVRRVEELGFHTFLIRDHFVPDFFGDQLAPVPAMMAAAAATTTLRVGTLVLDNDYRHPVILAKEAATIDVLSGGRLEFGIGAGWLRSEYEGAGMTFDAASVRIGRLEEALRVFKGLFGDGPFSLAGEHYTIREIENYPTPVQRPHPPILIGAGKPRMLRLAGREADIVSILTTSVATGTLEDDPTERLARSVELKLALVREGAGERFDRIELSLIPTLVITAERRHAAERMIRERGWSGVTVDDVLEMPSVFIGSVDQICDDMLARRERFGFSYYVVSDTVMESFAPIVARLTRAESVDSLV